MLPFGFVEEKTEIFKGQILHGAPNYGWQQKKKEDFQEYLKKADFICKRVGYEENGFTLYEIKVSGFEWISRLRNFVYDFSKYFEKSIYFSFVEDETSSKNFAEFWKKRNERNDLEEKIVREIRSTMEQNHIVSFRGEKYDIVMHEITGVNFNETLSWPEISGTMKIAL